ncbi:MAG: hypothetical protein R3B96_14610 [Pirellulaceae bacterium]
MIDYAYLNRGLTGLAQAHRAGTMAGHLGAALVAGYLYGEDEPDLPAEVHRGIEGELERVVAGGSNLVQRSSSGSHASRVVRTTGAGDR